MPLISIMELLNDEHCLDRIVRESPNYRAAVMLLDSMLTAHRDTLHDGRYIELPAVGVMEACEQAGIDGQAMQFVLNLVRNDVYAFGGRKGAVRMDYDETVKIMMRVLRDQEGGDDVMPVHRFDAEKLLSHIH